MHYSPVSINASAFDGWRPHKLVGHGSQLVTTARELLAVRGHELSRSLYIVAEDLLD